MRTALLKGSGGKRASLRFGGRHPSRAAMTPRLLNALSQSGAAIPSVPATTPPSAGPTARLTFMPTLLAATAEDRSDFGTSSVTTACQAGAVTAEPTVTMKLNTNRLFGVIRCSH